MCKTAITLLLCKTSIRSHTIPLIHSYTPGLIWWWSYTLLLLPLVTYNSSHSLLYIRTDLMAVLHTAAIASCLIQFLSFTPIHQDWSDGGLTHCCYCLLSHSYTSGLIWWRSNTLLLLPLVSLLYIRTDLMAVLHTAATASCLTPIHQDWSDGGLTHCCCCLLSHTIPLIHSYTSGLIWWRSNTLLLLPLVSLLYIRTDLMAVLHTAAAASCHIQFLSFTPIHQDRSDGGLTHCCYCLLSHTIPHSLPFSTSISDIHSATAFLTSHWAWVFQFFTCFSLSVVELCQMVSISKYRGTIYGIGIKLSKYRVSTDTYFVNWILYAETSKYIR